VRRPLFLGIESSCDDTACAVVDGDGRVLSSVVSSQLAAHRPFGGVVPEIASREHLSNWPAVSGEALEKAGVAAGDLDGVAATSGPGLVGALLVGLTVGKAVAWALGRPFYAVHHLEGHLYSPFVDPTGVAHPIPERFVGLIVSGGHTTITGVEGRHARTLVETRDDAIGEAFDKVGKRMGLAYPQGPLVDQWAERGEARRAPLSIAAPGDPPFFSYSGLKTQAVLAIEAIERRLDRRLDERASDEDLPSAAVDLLAGFRAAAVGQVVDRLERLHRRKPFEVLAVSGGVAANRLLRRELGAWAARRSVDLRLVPLSLAGDNAAMIAFAAQRRAAAGDTGDAFSVEAASRIPFAAA
jgi:N6-L-threonylcarbamoyladenine synthase